jgi:hypothetical protein
MDANQIEDWLAESQLPERAELDLIIPLIPELTPEPTPEHNPTIEPENIDQEHLQHQPGSPIIGR